MALYRANLGVVFAIDKVDPKLWAAAIAVIIGVFEWREVLAINAKFHGDLLAPEGAVD